MERDAATTEQLENLLTQLISLTQSGALGWEKQIGSAHRYARWKNNLLILGPSDPAEEANIPRYLFITPFDSPLCVELNSHDPRLGPTLLQLSAAVEQSTRNEPAVDPFALHAEVLQRLEKN